MLGGDQPRVDHQAAGLDGDVVEAAPEGDAAELLDLDAAAGRAEIQGQPLQGDDAMAEAVQVGVAIGAAGQVVDQQHGRVAAGEELLEGEDLAAVAQRILREQPHLRQAVEDDPPRLHPLDLVLDQLDGLAEFGLPRVQDALLPAVAEHVLRRGELEQLDPVEVPAVRPGDGPQFLGGLGEGDVEHRLAVAHALQQELQREGGLARSRLSLDQIEPVRRQAPVEDLVQAGGAGGDAGVGGVVVHVVSRGCQGADPARRRQASPSPDRCKRPAGRPVPTHGRSLTIRRVTVPRSAGTGPGIR